MLLFCRGGIIKPYNVCMHEFLNNFPKCTFNQKVWTEIIKDDKNTRLHALCVTKIVTFIFFMS